MRESESGHNDQKYFIIVGDWVIDEYWFLVRHHTDVSSHTGFTHYRISTHEKDIVTDLCGAGHVARVIYQLQGTHSFPLNLIGLGRWNSLDTKPISHFIHSRQGLCEISTSSFKLSVTHCDEVPEIELYSLTPNSATIRVVRLYHDEGDGLRQLGRIDWEPQKKSSQKEEKRLRVANLNLPKQKTGVSIIVNDLDKGAVDDEIIDELKLLFPDSLWYVRSKKQQPKWLEKINDRLGLLVIGPEVAALINPWPNWLVKGRLTLEAREIIDPLFGKNVVLISDDHEIIARINGGEECVTGYSTHKPALLSQLGFPTAFFAALVLQLHENNNELDKNMIKHALEHADQNAGVPIPSGVTIPQETRRSHLVQTSWKEEVDTWNAARSHLGIIKGSDGKEFLEVWRGYSQLPGYIACIREKRLIIERMGRHLRAFQMSSRPNHSLKVLFQADPAAGKTFLAKSLAGKFGFDLLSFDITTMVRREEIIDLFDAVANAQASADKKTLVFVDEINALVEGDQVYSNFLTPLEEEVYVRGGKKFGLQPCVWMFAGTRLEQDVLKKAEKLSDFKSRLTITERIDYESLKSETKEKKRLENEAKLEQVYLAARMIHIEFPDVKEISKEILEYFYSLDPAESPARRIRKLAQSIKNVQYGQVMKDNCSEWENVEWKENKDTEEFVRLIF